MWVEKTKVTLQMEEGELNDIAFSLKESLLATISKHYNVLQNNEDGEALFFERERRKLNLTTEFLSLIGCSQVARDMREEIKLMFKTKREERAKLKPGSLIVDYSGSLIPGSLEGKVPA